MSETPSGRKAGRAQNEAVGYILVLGVVIAGAVLVAGFGATALNSTEQELTEERAEVGLTQFSSKAGLVALDETNAQEVSFATDAGESFRVDEDAGRMRILITNLSTGDQWSSPVMNTTLGAVTYEGDGTAVAYQGGGVWRGTDNGGQMISPPEFHYRDETLTLPTITVRGEGALGGQATVTQSGETTIFPTADDLNKTNPLDNHLVTLEVQSEYYRAWGRYFEDRTEGSVDYPEPDTVRLNLTTPVDGTTVDGAMVVSDGGVFTDWKAKAKVDSYDSSVGDYASTGGGNDGVVYHAGELTFKNGGVLNGSLVIENRLQMKQNSEIKENLTHGGDVDFKDAPSIHVEGEIETGAEVPDPEPADNLIAEKVTSFQSDNDNPSHAATITALETGSCSSCTLTAGQYYLDEIDLRNSHALDLEPGGGTIEIVVDDDIILKNDASIEVVGDGEVKFYANKNVDLGQSSRVHNNGDNSPQFWLFMRSDRAFTMKQNSAFVGVVYGPPTDTDRGVKANLKADSELYGGIVGKMENLNNDADLHYDTALGSTTVFDDDEYVVPVTYLHVTTNSIEVSG